MRSSAPPGFPSPTAPFQKKQQFGGNFLQLQHGQTVHPIFPCYGFQFSSSLLAHRRACTARGSLLSDVPCFCWCYNTRTSQNQKSLFRKPRQDSLGQKGDVKDFPPASQRKAKPTKCLYVSRIVGRQSTAQRAALNRPDSHWK